MDAGQKRPQPATQDATRPLRDAVFRLLRARSSGWVVLTLHLSRLAGPAPRPHHVRIARAVLEDAAARREGQLFGLPNGDLLLLFAAPDGGVALATTLAQLFAPDAPDASLLMSRWSLPAEVASLLAFLDAMPLIASPSLGQEPDAALAAILELSQSTDTIRVRELLERQTGVLMALSGANRVMPLFREVRFSLPALEARAAAAGHVTTDPFVFRHLITKLEQKMLGALVEDLGQSSGVAAWARGGRMALHVEMSVEAALSPALDALAEAGRIAEARIAVEIPILDICADIDRFLTARERLRQAEFSIVIDQVTQHSLRVLRPATLEADMLKLDWSRVMEQSGEDVVPALESFGSARVILQGADTEEAMRWGIANGIRRFQGRHVDAILAASRMAECPASGRCTLRQCLEREAAATPAGRSGCTNLPLLDGAAPGQARPE